MDANKSKELLFLEKLLDNENDGKYGRYHYDDFIERGNYRIRRSSSYNEARRETVLMPDNPEHSELDWWIMMALNDLKVADIKSVWTYLRVAKILHPELLFSINDPRLIKRRLNFLTRAGYIMQVCYVINTDVDASVADELWKHFIREQEDEIAKKKAAENAVAFENIFDEYDEDEELEETLDEDTIKNLKSSYFNRSEYGKQVGKNIDGDLIRGLGSMGAEQNIKKFYGKNASLVRMFMLELKSSWILETRYGSVNTSVQNLGNPIHRFVYKDMALASIAKVATSLSEQKSFRRYGNCLFRSKFNGAFTVPVEMRFEVEAKDGIYKYDCALFHSYAYTVEGKELEEYSARRVQQTIYDLKNFIGQRGNIHGKPIKRDAFAIVVCNDAVDLMKFLDSLNGKASAAECNRIFFTGEGVIDSEFGLSRMIGITLDETQVNGFTLYPAKIPVVY